MSAFSWIKQKLDGTQLVVLKVQKIKYIWRTQQQSLIPEITTRLPKIIHRPHRQQLHNNSEEVRLHLRYEHHEPGEGRHLFKNTKTI